MGQIVKQNIFPIGPMEEPECEICGGANFCMKLVARCAENFYSLCFLSHLCSLRNLERCPSLEFQPKRLKTGRVFIVQMHMRTDILKLYLLLFKGTNNHLKIFVRICV